MSRVLRTAPERQAAQSDKTNRGRRRSRLTRTLVLGALAVGVPAAANALLARRKRRLSGPVWGRPRRFAWSKGDVAFQALGQGPPVVLVHDFGPGHDAEQWHAVGELLARRSSVFAIDLLGWGRSDMPDTRYDNELYLRLLEDFIDQVVGESVVLVAAGLPAAYSAQLAVDRPDLVGCLGLVGPKGLVAGDDEPRLGDALMHRLLRLPVFGTAALNLLTSREALAHRLRRDVFSRAERAHAAVIQHYYESSHQPGAHRALAAYLSGYLNHRIDAVLARVACPTLLAWGREATSPPVENAEFWLARLDHATLEVIDDCGALPHVERPGAFARRLTVFLDRAAA